MESAFTQNNVESDLTLLFVKGNLAEEHAFTEEKSEIL